MHQTKLRMPLLLLVMTGVASIQGHLLAGADAPAAKDYSKEQTIQTWCEPPEPFELRIGLPGFLSGLSGDFGVKGVVAPLDVSVATLLKHLDAVPITLSASLRYQRWEFMADGEYFQFHDSVTLPGLLFTDADLGLKFAFWEGFVGYRLVSCKKAAFSVYAGARYTYYSGDFRIANNADPRFPIIRDLLGIPQSRVASGSEGWVDPVIGFSGRLQVAKAVTLYASGDIGGFDANSGDAFKLSNQNGNPVLVSTESSDWSYQIQGGVEIQWSRRLFTQLGWRYMKYDYQIGGFTNKTALNGPMIQAGLTF